MKLLKLLAIASLGGFAFAARAQEAPSLDTPIPVAETAAEPTANPAVTWEDVLATLDARHPLLDAAARERGMAEGDLQSAEGAFDVAWRTRGTVVPLGGYPSGRIDTVVEVPTPYWGLTLFGGYRWGSDSFADYDGKQITNEAGEVRAGAILPIWRNGPIDRRRANIERAEIGAQFAELSVAERQIELARLAALRYWDWAAAGRRLTLVREMLSIAEERDLAIRARALAGDLPELEVIENSRVILQRQQQVVAAERSLAQAAFELSLYYRNKDGLPILLSAKDLPVSLPKPAPEVFAEQATVADALARRPELGRLRGQRDQSLVEREWAGNQRAPAIDFTVLGSQDLGQGSDKRSPFELELSLLVDIPIERNVADGRVKAAEAQIARAEAQSAFTAERIATDVRDAASAVEFSRKRVLIAHEEVDVARVLMQAERDKFELGDSSLLFVNLREQTALEAGLREVDALFEYHRSRVSLTAAVGTNANPALVRTGR